MRGRHQDQIRLYLHYLSCQSNHGVPSAIVFPPYFKGFMNLRRLLDSFHPLAWRKRRCCCRRRGTGSPLLLILCSKENSSLGLHPLSLNRLAKLQKGSNLTENRSSGISGPTKKPKICFAVLPDLVSVVGKRYCFVQILNLTREQPLI